MSTPLKPWEQRILQSSAPVLQAMPGPSGSRARAAAPSLPPRPNVIGPTSFASSHFNRPMGLGYSSYDTYNSYGGYNSYGSYGSYPGYRSNFLGNYGGGYYGDSYGYGPETRFIQMAEESTRGAFQGIESLVRAFGSVAMMLDSTFFAVQSSFRAVLGVAENFGRIRTMFGQLWSSFAILRFLNWCYRKLLQMLGVKGAEDLGKVAWNEAMEATSLDAQSNTSTWPIFMFLGMIVSAPYLISKLLPPLVDKRDPKNWGSPGIRAIALHEFHSNNQQELPLTPGDNVLIAPPAIQHSMGLANTGWVFVAGSQNQGIVPKNYIQILSSRKSIPRTPQAETVPPVLPAEMGEQFEKIEKSSQKDH